MWRARAVGVPPRRPYECGGNRGAARVWRPQTTVDAGIDPTP